MRKINTLPNDLDEAITKNVKDDDDLLERVIKQTTDAYAQQNIMNRVFMAKISDYQHRYLVHTYGPIYTEARRRCCDVASNIALIQLSRFLLTNQAILSKMDCNPNWSDLMQTLKADTQINRWCLV